MKGAGDPNSGLPEHPEQTPDITAHPDPIDVSGDPLVTLIGAGVRFGNLQALAAVDLVLHRGECLALVGPNGAGKTTLLRLLHGVQTPQASATGAPTRIVHTAAGAAGPLRSAMVFQRPFFVDLSVRRNLLLALWLQRVPRTQRGPRCDEALRRVGLARDAGRRALELSGGQQQRLALARAWALKPDLLFLDEPTASLDPVAKREVESLVAGFVAEGMTLVISTHNLGQAKRLATRVACVEAGRLQVVLPTRQFFDEPALLPASTQRFLKGELAWPDRTTSSPGDPG
jgi:tungstate transport system ATP-binding protein